MGFYNFRLYRVLYLFKHRRLKQPTVRAVAALVTPFRSGGVVRDTEGNVAGGHMLAGRVTVLTLVAEKYVVPISFEKRPFGKPSNKHRLLYAHIMAPERTIDALWSRPQTA